MNDGVRFIEYDGETPQRKEPCGTARIIEKGFDTDAMKRYVILLVDSPIEFFHGEHRVTYGMDEYLEDGATLPAPMPDDVERKMLEQIASYYRAVLVD